MNSQEILETLSGPARETIDHYKEVLFIEYSLMFMIGLACWIPLVWVHSKRRKLEKNGSRSDTLVVLGIFAGFSAIMGTVLILATLPFFLEPDGSTIRHIIRDL